MVNYIFMRKIYLFFSNFLMVLINMILCKIEINREMRWDLGIRKGYIDISDFIWWKVDKMECVINNGWFINIRLYDV